MTTSELQMEDENDSIVSDDELFVSRDSGGELLPTIEEAPDIGKVKVIPMTFGSIREYFGPDTQMDDIEAGDVAEILRNHVVQPDLSEVTAQEVEEEMKPMAPQSLLLAVMQASGVDVNMDALENQEAALEGN